MEEKELSVKYFDYGVVTLPDGRKLRLSGKKRAKRTLYADNSVKVELVEEK